MLWSFSWVNELSPLTLDVVAWTMLVHNLDAFLQL